MSNFERLKPEQRAAVIKAACTSVFSRYRRLANPFESDAALLEELEELARVDEPDFDAAKMMQVAIDNYGWNPSEKLYDILLTLKTSIFAKASKLLTPEKTRRCPTCGGEVAE